MDDVARDIQQYLSEGLMPRDRRRSRPSPGDGRIVMDEERLAEIEAMHERLAGWKDMPEREWRTLLTDLLNASLDLVAEVRRVRQLSQDNDQAYSDGVSSGHADIVGIISEGRFDRLSDTDIVERIEVFLDRE